VTEHWVGLIKSRTGSVWHAAHPRYEFQPVCETSFDGGQVRAFHFLSGFGRPTCKKCLQFLDRAYHAWEKLQKDGETPAIRFP